MNKVSPDNDDQTILLDAGGLRRWTADSLISCGVPGADAELAAGFLVRASLRGSGNHGIARLPSYVDKLLAGEIQAAPKAELASHGNMIQYDGGNGLGQVTLPRVVQFAVERTREFPLVCCSIGRAGHLDAIGLYVLAAAERGMIAILCKETPPLMALPGSSGAAIGNNPIAFAIPLADRPALVFDMANSRVARNKVRETLRNKTMLPEDWAIGTDGRPTTDPAAALAGALLPLGDHKGIGLAMLVHALAGSLQGEVFSSGPDTDPGTAFLMVINPDHFVARTTFDAHVNHWLTHYLTATGAGARYPGQRAAAIERDRLATGVPLRASLVRSLRAIGDRLGQPFAPAEMAP